ncbi:MULTISPECIES: hypothetical protein [Streptomyces]|nr:MULTISPECIES: hypothetical protein [Streptomyces]WSQ89901.1 hypothetical protein OG425_00215 [Streptomyces globisporus]
MTQNAMKAGEPGRIPAGGYGAVRSAHLPVVRGQLRALPGTDRARRT